MRTLDELSRGELATLGCEYMLFGHLLNRAALPHVHFQIGPEGREAVAIEEWMGASPIYTRRMQARMRFTGTGVGTIFKGFQLDVGFPHQYMDVHYGLESEERGTFWLKYLSRGLDLRNGIGTVIGVNTNPQFPDVVYIIAQHAEQPTTYEAVVVWRQRKYDLQSPGRGTIIIR